MSTKPLDQATPGRAVRNGWVWRSPLSSASPRCRSASRADGHIAPARRSNCPDHCCSSIDRRAEPALAQTRTPSLCAAMPNGHHVAIVGGGPAGLMASDVLAHGGAHVTVYDQMPAVGRKFLLAGRGGLNLTHSESIEQFLQRYGSAEPPLRPAIA